MASDNASAHHSAAYDLQVRGTIPYYDCFHWETINVIRAAGMKPDLWLDTGCGTGTLVEKAIKAFPGTKFILADPSKEMMEQARKKLECYTTRIKYLEPAQTIDVPKQLKKKVDVLTAIQSHHYMNEKERADTTKVCFDLLKPKGIYITFENIRPATEKGTEIGLSNWKHYQMVCGKKEEDAEKHIQRFGKEYFPITVDEHIKLLKTAGYKTVELLWHSYMQAGFYAIK